MMKILILTAAVLVAQQLVQVANGAPCSTNPCNLVTGFGTAEGYNCFDISGSSTDSVCTCPNNVPAVVNGPCRVGSTSPAACNRTCANGGVCNIVNGQQVCWCLLGYSGTFCEIQGTAGRCSASLCQAGTCFERTVGASVYAYCQCNPGYCGVTCNQCYFQCSRVGAEPDTAFCSIGRYFYCPQASGAPIVALCPDGARFNRFTGACDSNYNCT